MLKGTCHCGAVTVEVPRKPRRLTSCNCSICHRYGTLWAYYKGAEVKVTHARGAVDEYAWGDKSLKFIRCAKCGCIMQWTATKPTSASRTGVNARNFEPAAIASVRVRRLDGASTWEFLD